MNIRHGRGFAVASFAAALLLAAAAGCGSTDLATKGTAAKQAPKLELSVAQAAAVLAAFDQADSAASTAGDVAALRKTEAAPSLDDSVAAVHRALASHAKQAPFSHTSPVFAIPAGDPGCFLVAASLKSKGDEVASFDLSEFAQAQAGWALDMHVIVGQSAEPELASIGARPATLTDAAISVQRRQAIASQIFARTTGTPHPDTAVVASSVVLDQQLGAGWKFYLQSMNAAHMTVRRTMTSSAWSECAAQAGSSTIAFLTIYATDTVTPLAGGPADAVLSPKDPDLIGVGHAGAVTGKSIMVQRVEEFALSVPAAAGAPAVVLGLVDAPISVAVGAK